MTLNPFQLTAPSFKSYVDQCNPCSWAVICSFEIFHSKLEWRESALKSGMCLGPFVKLISSWFYLDLSFCCSLQRFFSLESLASLSWPLESSSCLGVSKLEIGQWHYFRSWVIRWNLCFFVSFCNFLSRLGFWSFDW